MVTLIADNHADVGSIAVPDMHEKRKNHGKKNALLHAKDDNRSCGNQCKEEFTRRDAANCRQASVIDKLQADQENNRGENRDRQEAQWSRKEEQNHKYDGGGGEMRQLTASPRGVDHGCFGGTTVYNKGAAAACYSVGNRQSHQIRVLTKLISITQRVSSGRCGALSE